MPQAGCQGRNYSQDQLSKYQLFLFFVSRTNTLSRVVNSKVLFDLLDYTPVFRNSIPAKDGGKTLPANMLIYTSARNFTRIGLDSLCGDCGPPLRGYASDGFL
jgi:hypothetical protein